MDPTTSIIDLNEASLSHAARSYAAMGWKIIPIWWIDDDGRCGCGYPHCDAPGKHPMIALGRGLENASSKDHIVAKWWRDWPNANVAIATGRASGVVVIDVDQREESDTNGGVVVLDGRQELESWLENERLRLPTATLTQRTGGGGDHVFIAYPDLNGSDDRFKNAVGWLPCVDLKADGGYVLVAPSRHKSGGRYLWLNAYAPAHGDPDLVARLRVVRGHGRAGHKDSPDAPDYPYREAVAYGPRPGHRDDFYNKRAFELRKQDWPREAAETELRRVWELAQAKEGEHTEPYAWSKVLEKIQRIWETVEPDPVNNWDPMHAVETARIDPVMTARLPSQLRPENDTDDANALRLVHWYGDQLRHATEGGWYVWTGVRWSPDVRGQVMEWSKISAHKLAVRVTQMPDGPERDRMARWAHASRMEKQLNAAVRLAQSDSRIAITHADLDRNPLLLNCPNGVVDLETGRLFAHDPELLQSHVTTVPYVPDARDEHWESFLRYAVNGDEDLGAYLRAAAGYSLTGLTTEECMFVVHGPTLTGKSTFVRALHVALGSYATTIPSAVIAQRRGFGTNVDAEVAQLVGRRFVASVELDRGSLMNDGVIKQITGGDVISARHLYRKSFNFTPRFKLWMATNYVPASRDQAILRRIRLLPFRHQPAQPLDTLKPWVCHPSGAGPAVLAWMVRGCREWLTAGELVIPQVVRNEIGLYAEESDPLERFLNEYVVMIPSARADDAVTQLELYDTYVMFSTALMREKPFSLKAFNLALKERNWNVIRRSDALRTRVWQGRQLHELARRRLLGGREELSPWIPQEGDPRPPQV